MLFFPLRRWWMDDGWFPFGYMDIKNYPYIQKDQERLTSLLIKVPVKRRIEFFGTKRVKMIRRLHRAC